MHEDVASTKCTLANLAKQRTVFHGESSELFRHYDRRFCKLASSKSNTFSHRRERKKGRYPPFGSTLALLSSKCLVFQAALRAAAAASVSGVHERRTVPLKPILRATEKNTRWSARAVSAPRPLIIAISERGAPIVTRISSRGRPSEPSV